MTLKGARVVVQGFGNAGTISAQLLHGLGCKVIAVNDSRGAIINEKGLNVPDVIAFKERTGSVVGYPEGEALKDGDELLALPCDVLVPAALENAITGDNAHRVNAKVIAEAANGPLTPEADKILFDRGIFIIPDILCNAGGVTVSYFEWAQDEQHVFWDEDEVYTRLERIMKWSFKDVLKIHLQRKVNMRLAANMLGIGRVAEATRLRGLYP
jgi:glutamate dehydrogenase/leucine dehydrogenase